MAAGGLPAATPLATVELSDCVARGEAVFLSVEDLQPVSLLWDNGLLATSDQLLTAVGGQAAPKPDEVLRLELRHLTAAVRGGLCRLSATPANPYQLTVQFVCTDDIILTSPGTPLVEQEGAASVEKSRQRFVWNGDRNYYQDVDLFWLVRTADSPSRPGHHDVQRLEAHWGPSRENQPSREPLAWRKSPSADRPLHAHTAADYTLEDPTFNDASERRPRLSRPSAPSAPQRRDPGAIRSGGLFRPWQGTWPAA